MHVRAGHPAQSDDLIDLNLLLTAYEALKPDVSNLAQKVVFGTSGHRGSSLDRAFNETHILAIAQAIADHRSEHGISGPLFLGRDTHALSELAWRTVIEVLIANDIEVLIDSRDGFTPTPAVSLAVLNFNRENTRHADGIVITPSHNPPRDGGIKYNPPTGGPADGATTAKIAARANQLIEQNLIEVRRVPFDIALGAAGRFDFLSAYVDDLPNIVDLEIIRDRQVRIAVDPLGGASVAYWTEIAHRHRLDITVVNKTVDPRWAFMPLDTDGKIRMDCSSPCAMANLVGIMTAGTGYDVAIGNDPDADRHGIVTPDAGLMNPNHFLAAAISYLVPNRTGWSLTAAIGKTMVSSSIIDRLVEGLDRPLFEVPVGFKYFVPGLLDGSLSFGGEESAGATFLRRDGTVWTTDKDGIVMGLLAAEIYARTGESASRLYNQISELYGKSSYARVDAPANHSQRTHLSSITLDHLELTTLGDEPIVDILTKASGNGEDFGGFKVVTKNTWFAARPSGTENSYKIYAESFRGIRHLSQIQEQAKDFVQKIIR